MIDKQRLEEKCSTWNITLTGTQLVQLDAGGEYWSSTEYDDYDAWYVGTTSGAVAGNYKYENKYVRAFLAL